VTAISADDLAIIRQFVDRRSSFLPEARARLGAELADRYRPRVAGAPAELPTEAFLEQLAAVSCTASEDESFAGR